MWCSKCQEECRVAADDMTSVAVLSLAHFRGKTSESFVQRERTAGLPVLYGLKTCDTCRNAARVLEAAGKTVEFRDVRADPLSEEALGRFEAAFGDALVNRRSTTWRGLSEAERSAPALTLLARHPALMKRPVIEDGEVLTLGWDKAARAAHLG